MGIILGQLYQDIWFAVEIGIGINNFYYFIYLFNIGSKINFYFEYISFYFVIQLK